MSEAYLKGSDVFVDGVDVKRAARKLSKLYPNLFPQPAADLNNYINVIAQCVGFNTRHDLNVRAQNNRRAPKDLLGSLESRQMSHAYGGLHLEPMVALDREALMPGASFPSNLPERFGKSWREKVERLFKEALERRAPGRRELIALMGAAGSGKTILARHLAKEFGGVVIDPTLTNNKAPGPFCKPGTVVVYDRPAVLPKLRHGLDAMPKGQPDLDYFRQQRRATYNPFEFSGLYGRLQNEVEMFPTTHFVVTVPSETDVQNLLESSFTPGVEQPISQPASFSWKAVHVVDLDALEVRTSEPRPIRVYLAERHEPRKHEIR